MVGTVRRFGPGFALSEKLLSLRRDGSTIVLAERKSRLAL
jgi:hypothetical protein